MSARQGGGGRRLRRRCRPPPFPPSHSASTVGVCVSPPPPSPPLPRSFNVYVSQPEVKPGCVLRRSNVNVLESRGLVDGAQVRYGATRAAARARAMARSAPPQEN